MPQDLWYWWWCKQTTVLMHINSLRSNCRPPETVLVWSLLQLLKTVHLFSSKHIQAWQMKSLHEWVRVAVKKDNAQEQILVAVVWWLDSDQQDSWYDWWTEMMSNVGNEQRWAVVMSSSEQCYSRVDVMSREDEQPWCDRYFLCEISILYCKSKLVLLLRLGYLKPFLAGSKKTRQGPGWKVGALCISRCWFYLAVVAEPN